MKVEYRRDIQNSYLVLIAENQDIEKSYDFRMLMENQIEGLLACERKLLNNDVLYYYDVTSQVSLEDRCKVKKVQGHEMLLLLNQLLGVLDELEEYLLSEQALCLLPQYIYIDEKEEKVKFCYVPGERWDFQKQIRELMEYLLPYLEHDNQESMMIGYGLYHYILREQFSIEGLHMQINTYHGTYQKVVSTVEQKEVLENTTTSAREDEIWTNSEKEDVELEEKKQGLLGYRFRGFCTFVGFSWILSGWFLWRNLVEGLWIWGIIGVLLITIGIFITIKYGKEKKENTIAKKSEIVYEIEQDEECTQILNLAPNRKVYVLKNENEVITLKDKTTYIIGRDENLSDIVLRSSVISRKHAQIHIDDNRCFLSDLHSRNGIRVNGMELTKGQEIELFGGEMLQFADVSYYFQQEN